MWKEKLKDTLKFAEDCLSYDGFYSINYSKYQQDFIINNDNFVIFGASSGGAKTKEALDKLSKQTIYFVDNDINKKGSTFMGKSVKHTSEILAFKNTVIIASMWFFDIKKQLEEQYGFILGLDYIISPYIIDISEMEMDNTAEKFLYSLKSNFSKYEQVFDLLEDDLSKSIYFRVLKGRLFYNATNPILSFMPKVDYNQYFHPKVKFKDNDIIVDAGTYIGDTIEEIIKNNVKFKKIYAFEPDETNFQKLLFNVKRFENIEIYKYGVWNKKETLHFKALGTSASAVLKNNKQKTNQSIETIVLDEFFKDKEKPTLVKMDIEGSEYEALLGLENIIKTYKPKLQICIYHKPEHLWQIPLLLKEWVKDYKLYVGHHSPDWAETVLYASI